MTTLYATHLGADLLRTQLPDLPHGKDLHGEQLKKVLTELFNEYCTDTVISKLAPCANSQRNESLNSVIGTKNPKTRYYSGSESSDFRVACGIAQVNVGYGYIFWPSAPTWLPA